MHTVESLAPFICRAHHSIRQRIRNDYEFRSISYHDFHETVNIVKDNHHAVDAWFFLAKFRIWLRKYVTIR